MKKQIALILAMGAFLMTTGCTKEAEPKIHTRYVAQGRYYTEGTIVTADGNEWEFNTDIISDKTPFDGIPIHVGFDDNGTPGNIYDDIILGVTWDVATNIYDDLETALSDKFEFEREGNNIHIKGGIQ